MAYGKPDAAITLSDLNPPDGLRLNAKRNYLIPNAIPDLRNRYPSRPPSLDQTPRLLMAGVLRESKGLFVLLEACALLHEKDVKFRLQLMGEFDSSKTRRKFNELMKMRSIRPHVELLGVMEGSPKWETFANADIFCFPSFVDGETFGLGNLEAMQFSLPIVATKWGGIPTVVEDQKTGLLIPPRDSQALANALEKLIQDPSCRRELGTNGRKRFEEYFRLSDWHRAMEQVFANLGT